MINRKTILLGLLSSLMVMPACLWAATIPADLQTGWQTIDTAVLKDDVTLLASDSLHGRLSLTAGDASAIQWIEQQFKLAGLKPANGHRYLQPVPVIQYVPDRKNSYIVLEKSTRLKRWHTPEVQTEFVNNVDVKGDVVFAGYGITAPSLHYDDYQQIDVRGKIVLVFEHEPQETVATSRFNGKSNTIYATNRIKALNAQRHGALAILIAPEPNRRHPSNIERYQRVGGSTARAVPLPSQVLLHDDLHIPVVVISDAVANAIVGSDLSLSAAQAAIDNDVIPFSKPLQQTRIAIHDRNMSRSTGKSYNVVGLLPGADPTLARETIIISAHHDHDGESGTQIWHGADDNASGTVGVVALARAMSKNAQDPAGLKPRRSILFVVFAGEERGLLGAYYMASHPLRLLSTTRAMINLDMIGRNEAASSQTEGLIDIPADTTNRLNLIGAHYSPDYLQTLVEANKQVGLVLDSRFDEEAALNVFFRSDQFPFVLHRIPAFWWFTGFHPDYHHTTDTADKINYPKMQRILQLAYLSGYDFANTATPPRFVNDPVPTSA
jgi:hypothetical protein